MKQKKDSSAYVKRSVYEELLANYNTLKAIAAPTVDKLTKPFQETDEPLLWMESLINHGTKGKDVAYSKDGNPLLVAPIEVLKPGLTKLMDELPEVIRKIKENNKPENKARILNERNEVVDRPAEVFKYPLSQKEAVNSPIVGGNIPPFSMDDLKEAYKEVQNQPAPKEFEINEELLASKAIVFGKTEKSPIVDKPVKKKGESGIDYSIRVNEWKAKQSK